MFSRSHQTVSGETFVGRLHLDPHHIRGETFSIEFFQLLPRGQQAADTCLQHVHIEWFHNIIVRSAWNPSLIWTTIERAVIRITGICPTRMSFLIIVHSSSPSRFGIMISLSTRSGNPALLFVSPHPIGCFNDNIFGFQAFLQIITHILIILDQQNLIFRLIFILRHRQRDQYIPPYSLFPQFYLFPCSLSVLRRMPNGIPEG